MSPTRPLSFIRPGLRLILAVLAASATLLWVSIAGAQAALPVGQTDGVRVDRAQGELVVTFTKRAARLYRRVAGRVILVECTDRPQPTATFGLTVIRSTEARVRAPKRRRRISTRIFRRSLDDCRIRLAPRTVKRGGRRVRYPRRLLVSVPLTQRGAIHLDEERKAFSLFRVLIAATQLAQGDSSRNFPLPAQFVSAIGRELSPLSVVPLSSPSETAPAGKLGYYSDGRRRATAVILSGSGRRLLVETEEEGLIRSNVLSYIYSNELD